MDLLKNISLGIVIFLIGAAFLLLGLTGGFTVSGYSLAVQGILLRAISSVIGAVLIVVAVYLEIRAASANAKKSAGILEGTTNRNCGADHDLYLHREEIHWAQYNARVSKKFWVCGTSLVPFLEKGLMQDYLAKGVKDIRVILPHSDRCYASHEQLEKYDQLGFGLVDNQVDRAREAYERSKSLAPLFCNTGATGIFRRYGGIMYSNITIFDQDAFISFYDCTGIGDLNFALHFNESTNKAGYALVEAEFQRMWDTQSGFGMKSKKKSGTSILFVNNANQILLFLRDDKKDIPFPNCWDVLGGNVEAGETPVECIIREMKEEIGIEFKNPYLFGVYDMNDRVECTFWQRADFDIRRITLNEGQRLKWFTEKEINKMTDEELAFEFKSIILDFFRQKPFEVSGESDALQ